MLSSQLLITRPGSRRVVQSGLLLRAPTKQISRFYINPSQQKGRSF